MRRALDTLLFALVAVTILTAITCLHGCTTPQVQSVDQKILDAKRAEDVVIQAADASMRAKLISPDQAQSVSTIAHQVDPLMVSAKAAVDAGDTANATKTMALVNALLAGLKTYVPPPPGASP